MSKQNITPSDYDDEMVAWVDEDENLIKVIPRALANSDPKYLHSEIAGIVYDENRRILLQQRAKTKRIKPSVWTVTVAGHVTYGDTLKDTFERELLEEMGVKVPRFTYIYRELVSEGTERHFCHWYFGEYIGGDIVIQKEEVDDWAWVGEDEYLDFSKKNNVDSRTEKIIQDFWSGKWDNLLG